MLLSSPNPIKVGNFVTHGNVFVTQSCCVDDLIEGAYLATGQQGLMHCCGFINIILVANALNNLIFSLKWSKNRKKGFLMQAPDLALSGSDQLGEGKLITSFVVKCTMLQDSRER